MTRTEARQIAETILEQLGGRRFLAMTGAKDLFRTEAGLQFSLPARFAKNGVNRVLVELDPSDTYSVTFGRIRGLEWRELAKETGVYADQLRAVFTERTGLATGL